MKNYQYYSEMLKNRISKKLENNTYLTRDNDLINVRLHSTNILTFNPDNSVKFNSDGWHTRTTLDRLNKYQDLIRIWSFKFVWSFNWNNKPMVFNDNMVIKGKKLIGAKKNDKKINKLLNKINLFADNYTNNLYLGKIEKPGSGDCWYCCMQTNEGQSLGEATKSKDHLLSHLKEKYYVPSLLLNTMKFAKLDNWQPYLYLLHCLWYKNDINEANSNNFSLFAKDQIKKSIKKYLRFQLL